MNFVAGVDQMIMIKTKKVACTSGHKFSVLKDVIYVLGWTFCISHLLVLLNEDTNNNDNTARGEAAGPTNP